MENGNGPRPPNLHNATRKNQKNIAKVRNITNFDRQAALFNGASMVAIKYEFSEVCQLNSPARTVR
jgi:hypothetical protein